MEQNNDQNQQEIEKLQRELAALSGQAQNNNNSQQSNPPTRDFLDYRLKRVWRKLPEPREDFEKWCGTAEARALIRKHDAAVQVMVDNRLDEVERCRGDFVQETVAEIRLRDAESEFSWKWEHLRLSNSDRLMRMHPSQYELR